MNICIKVFCSAWILYIYSNTSLSFKLQVVFNIHSYLETCVLVAFLHFQEEYAPVYDPSMTTEEICAVAKIYTKEPLSNYHNATAADICVRNPAML